MPVLKKYAETPILLMGGGGHCRSCIDVMESSNYEIGGIIDDSARPILNYPVVSNDSGIRTLTSRHTFLVTVGQISDPTTRVRLYSLVKECGGKLATVMAATARVSGHASIGEGTIVMHQCVVNAGAIVGNNVIINTMALIEHDCIIGDHTHISTAAVINGGCRIGSRVFVGSASVVSHGLSIADGAVVGAGSVVIKDITTAGVYAGNPAKRIK